MMAQRLFAGVAVAAAEEIRSVLRGAQRRLRDDKIRWAPPDKWHLTVEFFGWVEPERVAELDVALAQAAAQTPAFTMRLGGLGFFGPARRPRVLWLGVESAGLQALHTAVVTCLRAAGWPASTQPYAPHLTLGRVTCLRNMAAWTGWLADPAAAPVHEQTVRELILYESRAGQYVPLTRHPLR